MNQNIELYIHIPFCVKKCEYCDFLSEAAGEVEQQEYVEALVQEIDMYQGQIKGDTVTSVFLGGGTPSILTENQITVLFAALKEAFTILPDAEITIEINPGAVTREKLRIYRGVGINRLSIGLQSTNNSELQKLGRIHTYEEFLQTYHMAREEMFDNINIDLISAIPGQTTVSWKQTINKVIQLSPEHISAYSLIIEEGTLFYELYGSQTDDAMCHELYGSQTDDIARYELQGNQNSNVSFMIHCMQDDKLPDEDEEREIYAMTKTLLEHAGYDRYEISNYAKPGYECRHNLGYWDRVQYLGIGLGSSSLIGNRRFSHIRDRSQYCKQMRSYRTETRDGRFIENGIIPGITEDVEVLTFREQMEEYMFLGLRKMAGVSQQKFNHNFGVEMNEIYGEIIVKLLNQGLLTRKGDILSLTERGIDVSNRVLSEFL